jgi:hypothetical protein
VFCLGRFCDGDGTLGTLFRSCRATLQFQSQPLGYVLIDRAGVGFFLGDTELGQHFDHLMRRDFELPRQLVDSDFCHR